MKTLLKVTALFLMLVILSVGAQGWSETESDCTEIDPNELTKAFLEGVVSEKMAELESLNLASTEDVDKLYVRARTTGTETFTAAGETREIEFNIYWDDDIVFGHMCVGYAKIFFDPTMVEVASVTPGLFSGRQTIQGANWLVVDAWYLFFGSTPVNDPDVPAFSVTFRALQPGTATFSHETSDSSGGPRDFYITGLLHDMRYIPAEAILEPAGELSPDAPTDLVATAVSSSQIDLAWTDNSDNEDGFILERKTGRYGFYEPIVILDPNTNSYLNTDLEFYMYYGYRVRAYNLGGESDYSNEANAITFEFNINEIIHKLDEFYHQGLIKNQGIYSSLRHKLSNAHDAFTRGNITAAQNQLDAFCNQIYAQSNKGVLPPADTILCAMADEREDPIPVIRILDPNSPHPEYILQCKLITVTGFTQPHAEGEYEWSISPTNKAELKGDETGEIEEDDPITKTAIGVHGLITSTDLSDTVTITFTFTSETGAVTATSITVPIIAITFTVLTFSSNDNIGVDQDRIRSENENQRGVLINMDEPFTMTSSVRVETQPPNDISCRDWVIGFVHNLISQTDIYIYRDTTVTRQLRPEFSFPLLDSTFSDVPVDDQSGNFRFNNGVLDPTFPFSDRPRAEYFWDDPSTPEEEDTLEKVIFFMHFITWRVAYNESTNTIIYLNYYEWKWEYEATFDMSQPVGQRTTISPESGAEVLSEGEGEGNWDHLNLAKDPPVESPPIANNNDIWEEKKTP